MMLRAICCLRRYRGIHAGSLVSYTTTHQYNNHGQLTRTDGPRTDVQDVTVNAYDPVKGYLTSVTTPSGVVTYSGYDANHNVGTITDCKWRCHRLHL